MTDTHTPPPERAPMPDLVENRCSDAEHDAQQPYVERFTPGPWRVRESRTTFSVGEVSGSARYGRVAHMAISPLSLERSAEGRANAHLIAAAPDLYAALREIEQIAKAAEAETLNAPNAPGWTSVCAIALKARAVLRKVVPLSPTASRQDERPNTDGQ